MDHREKLKSWLNRVVKVEITDGRVLVGKFCCTDKAANVIIGQCDEFLPNGFSPEPRNLGLVMVPGPHIKKMYLKSSLEGEVM